jgi:hypothetical protein
MIEGHADDSRLVAAGALEGPTGGGHEPTEGGEGGSGGTRPVSGCHQCRDGRGQWWTRPSQRGFSATPGALARGGPMAAGCGHNIFGGGGTKSGDNSQRREGGSR